MKKELLDLLACPADHGEIRELESENKLECVKCGRLYPVVDGIPIMLIDKAVVPSDKTKDTSKYA